jgi:hypothetical protein
VTPRSRLLATALVGTIAATEPILFARERARSTHDDRFVKLERPPCHGTCPGYRLSISRDGKLSYFGHTCVAATGWHTKQLSPASLTALRTAVARSRVLESPRTCLDCEIFDASVYSVEIWLDGKHTMVLAEAQRTAPLQELFDAIEDADVKAWIGKPVRETPLSCKGDITDPGSF